MGLLASATPARADDELGIRGRRGWIADADGGLPVLDSGSFKFVASGTLGYRWKKLEVIASGGINQYASASDNVFNNTTRAGGQLHGAYVTGKPGDRLRYLIVQDFEQSMYLTRYLQLSNPSSGGLLDFNLNIKNEDSHMLRGTTLVGALVDTPRTQAHATLGMGLQGELYVMTFFEHDDTGTEAGFQIDLQLSARQQVEVIARHEIVPRKLAVRVYSESSTFKLSRSSAAVKIDFSRVSEAEASASLFTYRQIESTNRLALDVPRFTFHGLMPSVFGGVDISLLRGDIGRSTAIVPVFGIGLTNGQL